MKKVKKLTIILMIVLLCLVSFIGIYVQNQNIMTNIIKDYDLGRNLGGYREERITPAKGEEITIEKVEQVKQSITDRLYDLGAQDYLIKVDYVTGEIVLELEENTLTDNIVADVYAGGVLKMVDSENHDNVFMTNEHIEEVSTLYSTTENGTAIYLDLKFTEEGAKIIEDLSTNAYKTIEEETTESEEVTEETTESEETSEGSTETTEGEETTEVEQPLVTLMIDDTELLSSSFDFPVTEGRLQLTLSSATTNQEALQEAVRRGNAIATVLNNGPLPIKYEITGNTYIYSEITKEVVYVCAIAMVIIVLIAFIVLTIKYKMPALLAGISYIGFIAIYLLALRYADVVITVEGIAGILVILILNYLLIQKILANPSIVEAFKEIGMQSIPVIFVIIAFCFINWTSIASFGTTMFWGVILTVIYHFVVTKALLEK